MLKVKHKMTLKEYQVAFNERVAELLAQYGPDIPVVTFEAETQRYGSLPLISLQPDGVHKADLEEGVAWSDADATQVVRVITIER